MPRASKLLVSLAILGLSTVVVGIAAGSSSNNGKSTKVVNRACFTYDVRAGQTHMDISLNRSFKHRVCIVGKPGKIGQAGAQGAQGLQGLQGLQGVAGPAGAAGAKGDTGPAGQVGRNGLDGLSGAEGPMGPAGAIGPVGPQGERGLQGEQGLPGADGANGTDGAPGADGAPGPAGPKGADGAPGQAGPQGPAGPQGEAGPAGPAGPKGDTGPAGPQGEAGLNGSTIVEVSETGTPGQKTTAVACPLTQDPNDDPNARMFAISGGFKAQGSVTESYRSANGHGWTVTQSSGNVDSLTVFAYCA
jgi:hypothetical protein